MTKQEYKKKNSEYRLFKTARKIAEKIGHNWVIEGPPIAKAEYFLGERDWGYACSVLPEEKLDRELYEYIFEVASCVYWDLIREMPEN